LAQPIRERPRGLDPAAQMVPHVHVYAMLGTLLLIVVEVAACPSRYAVFGRSSTQACLRPLLPSGRVLPSGGNFNLSQP
jgi:hypothetical protein